MSGIIGSAGSKSGLIGVNIGDACSAKLASTHNGTSGVINLSTWSFLLNDNTKLYSIATYGIEVSLTGIYMVNLSCFTEGRGGNTHSYMYFNKNGGDALYNPPLVAESIFALGEAGADNSGHGRHHDMKSFPAKLEAGNAYGIRSSQSSYSRNIPSTQLTSIAFTLLKIG